MGALQALSPNSLDAIDFRRAAGQSPIRINGPLVAMTTPPTISLLAENDADVVANGIRIMPARLAGSKTTLYDVNGDPHFETIGTPQGKVTVDAGDLARTAMLIGGDAQAARWPAAWAFECDAARFDVYIRALSTDIRFRLWVLDKASGRWLPHSVNPQNLTVVTSTRYRIKVDFGTSEPRTIMWQTFDPYFGGIIVPPTATVQRPKRRRQRFGVISDSTGRGASGVGVIESWPFWCAEYLDMDYWNLSIGGSGYIAAPSYQSRLQDVIDAELDYLVIAGGQNDKAGNTPVAITDAARTFIQAVKTASPRTRLFLGGIHMTTQALDVKNEPLETSLRALSVSEGIPFISLRDPRNILSTTPAWAATTAYLMGEVVSFNGLTWICVSAHTSTTTFDATKFRATSFLTGTGKVGTTVGNGNADIIMGSDGVHYSLDGHKNQGLWYAEQLIPHMADRL